MAKDTKTSKKTQRTSSVRLTMPTSWAELSDDELTYLYKILSCYTTEESQILLFLRLCQKQCSMKDIERVSIPQFAAATDVMRWMEDISPEPVRVSTVRGRTALDPKLHNVTFGTYISIENLYQGYLMSEDPKALDELFELLYPSPEHEDQPLEDWERNNLLHWMASLKKHYSEQFSEFFRPSSSSEDIDMLSVVNSEIRALTGGDITKEEQILQSDAWRALTELDAKAREARQLSELTHK